MSLLDKDFWIDLLADVHTLMCDGGVNFDWRTWAMKKIAKARQLADDIPLESSPEFMDKRILETILSRLQLHPATSEAQALDSFWHGLKDGTIELNRERLTEIFFLLYRLQEGFGPMQASD